MTPPDDRARGPILSRYGEPPTEADIDPRAPGAPLERPRLIWRLMNRAERRRILGHA